MLERFIKKNCKKQIKKEFSVEKIKEKAIHYKLNGKVMITLLIVGLIKKDIVI